MMSENSWGFFVFFCLPKYIISLVVCLATNQTNQKMWKVKLRRDEEIRSEPEYEEKAARYKMKRSLLKNSTKEFKNDPEIPWFGRTICTVYDTDSLEMMKSKFTLRFIFSDSTSIQRHPILNTSQIDSELAAKA